MSANNLSRESIPKNREKFKTDTDETTKSNQCTLYTQNFFTKFPHLKYFHKMDEAMEYIKEFNEKHGNKLFLFSEDISPNLNKRFYALDYKTFFVASFKKIFHCYECFNKEEPLKLMLDLDLKSCNIPQRTNADDFLDININIAIECVNKRLTELGYLDFQVIILKASTTNKQSAHIIYKNIHFKDVYHMKFFMMSVKCPLIQKDILDLSIYKKGSFRCLWNSKFGKKNNLEFYKGINYKYKNDKDLLNDCLVKNISQDSLLVEIELPKNIKIIKKKFVKRQLFGNQDNQDNQNNIDNQNNQNKTKFTKFPVSTLKKYLDLLDEKRADNYTKWIEIGMCLHNCNPKEECFKLWDTWSQKSESYSGVDINIYKWNSFSQSSLSIGTLKFYAKNDNADKYSLIECILEPIRFDTIKFESQFLLEDKKEKIKDKLTIVSQKVCEWWNSKDIKSLGILSGYDTGKTTLLKKIIREFEPPKILFVSCRQLLSQYFKGNFSKYGVHCYLDGVYHADKMICQIESLPKLLKNYLFDYDDYAGALLIPCFDLVVLDESESILNHFRSSTIKEKDGLFNLFQSIVYNSAKVLALDGDFGNRSYDFISDFPGTIILENTVKKDIKDVIFTGNRKYFDQKVDKCMKKNKNNAVISMSASIAQHFDDKYKDDYKTVLHTAKTDDSIKKELQDVDGFWTKFHLVTSSPSLGPGISYNLEHFYRVFVVLSTMSCSPRDLCQMINRIRKPAKNKVLIYLNGLPFREKANFYTYDEVKEYICDSYKAYVTPLPVKDAELNKMVLKYQYNLYIKILIHNEMEHLHKSPYYFVPMLIKLFEKKGYTYKYLDDKDKSKAEEYKRGTVMKDAILAAESISHETYRQMFARVMKNKASSQDKIKVEKYLIKKNWKIKVINEKFLEDWYGKTYVLFNLRFLLGKKAVEPWSTVDNDQDVLDFDKIKVLEQIKLLKDVFSKLGFEEIANGKKIEREEFKNNIKKVTEECEIFNNPNKSQPLFGLNKTKVSSIKSFLGFMNGILKDWGLILRNRQIVKKVKIKGVRKTQSINNYYLEYLRDINQYI